MVSILWMDIRHVFGENIRRFRVQAGLSQEAVAELMGVDRAHISSMERGAKRGDQRRGVEQQEVGRDRQHFIAAVAGIGGGRDADGANEAGGGNEGAADVDGHFRTRVDQMVFRACSIRPSF